MARITRQKSSIDITPKLTGKDEYLNELREILKQTSSLVNRRRIAQSAAGIVVNSARMTAKSLFKSQQTHYVYNTPKLIRRLKAPDGQGVKIATYMPGNLMRSIIDIAERRARLKKQTYKVIIGPYYRGRGPLGGKARAIYNSERKIDGYYAHMVFGNSRAFQQRVMIPALIKVSSQVLSRMRDEAARVLQEETKSKKYIDFE